MASRARRNARSKGARLLLLLPEPLDLDLLPLDNLTLSLLLGGENLPMAHRYCSREHPMALKCLDGFGKKIVAFFGLLQLKTSP